MAYADLNALIESLSAKEEEAKAANLKRQAVIESIFDEVIARYGPEGTYGKAAETLIEKQKVRDVSATAQRDIGRGLYGIRPYEAEWEATTGAEARLKLEDIKMERLSQAQLSKAGFLEGITDEYPDYDSIASLVAQAAGSANYGIEYGPTETIEGLGTVQWPTSASTSTTTPTYGGTPEEPYIPGVGSVSTGGTSYSQTVPTTIPKTTGGGWFEIPGSGLGRITQAEYESWNAKWQSAGRPGTFSEFVKSGGQKTKKTSTPSVQYGYSPYGAGGF